MLDQFAICTNHLFMALSLNGRWGRLPADFDVIPTRTGVIFEAGLWKTWWLLRIDLLLEKIIVPNKKSGEVT